MRGREREVEKERKEQCVCVCVRERERERERGIHGNEMLKRYATTDFKVAKPFKTDILKTRRMY